MTCSRDQSPLKSLVELCEKLHFTLGTKTLPVLKARGWSGLWRSTGLLVPQGEGLLCYHLGSARTRPSGRTAKEEPKSLARTKCWNRMLKPGEVETIRCAYESLFYPPKPNIHFFDLSRSEPHHAKRRKAELQHTMFVSQHSSVIVRSRVVEISIVHRS